MERTQKFLFLLKELMETGQVPHVPVHADSPMAIKAVQIFLKHTEELSPQTKALIEKYGSPLEWSNFYFDITQDESKKINQSNSPMIVVSSSGMVAGGRVLHHLMLRLPNPKNLCCSSVSRRPARAVSASRGERGRSRFSGRRFRSAHRSLRWSSSAIMLILPSCCNGYVHLAAAEGDLSGARRTAAASALRDTMMKELRWNVQVAAYRQKVEVE